MQIDSDDTGIIGVPAIWVIVTYTFVLFAHRYGGVGLAICITVACIALLAFGLREIVERVRYDGAGEVIFVSGAASLFAGIASFLWGHFFSLAWGQNPAIDYVMTLRSFVSFACLAVFAITFIAGVVVGLKNAFSASVVYGASVLLATVFVFGIMFLLLRELLYG